MDRINRNYKNKKSLPSCLRVRRGFEECACAHSSRRTPDSMQRGGPGGVARRAGVVGAPEEEGRHEIPVVGTNRKITDSCSKYLCASAANDRKKSRAALTPHGMCRPPFGGCGVRLVLRLRFLAHVAAAGTRFALRA